MSKFNHNDTLPYKTTSYEGGRVYAKSPIEEWLNFLFSSYVEDAYYETAEVQRKRFIELTEQVANKYGYDFVAKCAIFARQELGMRSIAQLTAAWLNDKQFDGKRRFFRSFPRRPDDVAEIFAALELLGQKYSHALNRGFGDFLSTLSAYSIGKYQMKGKTWNMHDIINRTHAFSEHIDAYQKGKLEVVDTWETAISGAQSQAEKEAEWKRLVEHHKLGYLALLRNLRNICECRFASDRWIADFLVPQITNRTSIENSLVFPYQIYSAAKNCDIHNPFVELALNIAFKISVANMPVIDGNVAIILDVSGSMEYPISARSNISIKEAGAVYAAALMLANPHIDFIKFGSTAKKCQFHMNDNVFYIIDRMMSNDGCGYGTDIAPAFDLMDRVYDSIFLISDMQIMDPTRYYPQGYRSNFDNYHAYCDGYNCNPHLYSFDLGNYRSQIAYSGNPNVHLLTSLSEKTFKMINLLSQGESIVDYINNVYDYQSFTLTSFLVERPSRHSVFRLFIVDRKFSF